MNVNLPILSWLKNWFFRIKQFLQLWSWSRLRRERWASYAAEWLVIVVVAYLYSGQTLLNFDTQQLQQTGEHNESATLPLLAEIGLWRYGEIPLWNPYMLTGFPHVGDFVNHFWNPIATLPVLIWGGINGMKVSIFVSFILAGMGQWLGAHVFGTRGFIRLWAALLFMVSGGLALLWRLGWYELLLGAVWFPWCFASLWWALHRSNRSSLVLAAICVVMVLTTGGGYYPVYLFVSLSVLVVVAIIWSSPSERWLKLRRAAAVALLSAGLLAVMLLPLVDGYYYTARDTLSDLEQKNSQSIAYALMNYVISAPEWFNTDILSKGSGWSWFYIGSLPVAALTLVPLVYSQAPWRRRSLMTLGVLTLVLLAWQANRYPPFSYIYDWIPFLYTFRFPNRLLIIATSPLVIMAGLGLQHLLLVGRRWGRGWHFTVARKNDSRNDKGFSLRWMIYTAVFLTMFLSLYNVYKVNQQFAFARQQRNAKAFTALSWLKKHDPTLYYTDLGGDAFFADWMPAAYELEMPIINFRYNRHLSSAVSQNQSQSPFSASAKYMVAWSDQPGPENSELLTEFEDVKIWHLPNALPFAFSAQPALLQSSAHLTKAALLPLTAQYASTNQLVVRGEPTQVGDQLVVLVSDYPGWRVFVDGQPAALQAVNGYLGTIMQPGRHTYTFVFRPLKYYVGLVISILTLVIMLVILVVERP